MSHIRRRSFGKVLLLAAVVAVPLTAISASTEVGATTVPVDATNYTMNCSSVSGTMKFSPSYRTFHEGVFAAGSYTTTVRARLSGCTATPTAGGAPISVSSGKVTGSFVSVTDGSCFDTDYVEVAPGFLIPEWYPLLYPDNPTGPGQLTTSWRTSPKLSSGNTVTTVNSALGGTAGSEALFAIPSALPDQSAGSFSGTDGGASSLMSTEAPLAGLTTACASRNGLKGIRVAGTANFG
jgi:hypothetical protein